MEDNDSLNLDWEFKRYLQILRPFLGQLTNENAITICNSWIQRLSDCREHEKISRNKYAFSLCYQVAKGVLNEPFLNYPPSDTLLPVPDSVNSDVSSESEYVVIEPDPTTEVLFKNKPTPSSASEYLSQGNEYTNADTQFDSDVKSFDGKSTSSRKKTILCYACPEILKNYTFYPPEEMYEFRAKNLIKKLREIKTENMMLHTELMTLKEESLTKQCQSNEDDRIIKVNNTTSTYIQCNESSVTLKSLKFKLQEVQDSRNTLIDKISCLQEQLENFNEIKKHEFEEMEAEYKLEIINIKTSVKDEMKDIYDKKIEEYRTNYESKINEMENKLSNNIQDIKLSKDTAIEEKNKVIADRDLEITRLKLQIDDLKNHLHSVLEKFIDKPTDNANGDFVKFRAQQLEKRLNKMEKDKIRSTRVYESKFAQLQREKHLAECSLQLQMVRQRAQVVSEVTDENQAELTAALNKLEGKYKEIVANVQATAIQRRVQDQMTLESILQAACGISHENPQATNQFPKTMRNQNQSYDSEISPLLHCNKGNKSIAEDSLGYCLHGERMGELFERVNIPQRDNSEAK